MVSVASRAAADSTTRLSMRTHWLNRQRTGQQHQVGQLDGSIIAQAPSTGGRAGEGLLPLIPGTDLYIEQPGAGGDYVPEGSAFTDIMAPPGGAAQISSIAYYFEGDLFTPGAQNWVYEPVLERTPLQTTWGRGFLRTPNFFDPIQPPQVYSNPNVFTNGIGGLVAGQMALQPLEEEPS